MWWVKIIRVLIPSLGHMCLKFRKKKPIKVINHLKVWQPQKQMNKQTNKQTDKQTNHVNICYFTQSVKLKFVSILDKFSITKCLTKFTEYDEHAC